MTRQQIRFAQASTLLSFFTLLCRSEKNLQDYTEGRRQTLPLLALLKIILNHASFSFWNYLNKKLTGQAAFFFSLWKHPETTQPSMLVEATPIFCRRHTHLGFGQRRANKQHSVHSFLYLTFSNIYTHTKYSTVESNTHSCTNYQELNDGEKKNPHLCMHFFHSSKSIHQFLRKAYYSYAHRKNSVKPSSYAHIYQDDDVELNNVLGCQSTYEGQTVTKA